jgi:hypothetical protein
VSTSPLESKLSSHCPSTVDRLSGFLTARFILRLRKWDVYRQQAAYMWQSGSQEVTTYIDEPRPIMTATESRSPVSPGTDAESHWRTNNPRRGLPYPRIVFAKGPVRPAIVEPTSIIEEFGHDIGPHSQSHLQSSRRKPPDVQGEPTESDYQWDWDQVAEEVGWRWWDGIPGPPMQEFDPPVSALNRACDPGRVV